jgi:hypothetical protein
MATVSKNFRVKNGLVVEGTTATVNGHNILTANNSTDNLTEGTTNKYFTDERAQEAVNSLISAGTHGNITIDYDDENNSLSFTVDQGLIPDTDSLPEGVVNEYFTDERAQDAVALAIAAGTHQNIGITYANGALSFAAENGVADSDTDDLDEGTTNLYFTNQRALNATSAAYDAAGSAATAESNANDYTDGEITTALTTAQGYADAAETDAINSANSYTDGRETAITTAYQTYADQAETDAKAYTDTRETAITTAYESYADTAEADAITSANSYTDTEIGDHSNLTTGVHGVSGDVVGTTDAQTLTNKTMGDDLLMDGFQISGLGTPDQADHAATKAYVDSIAEGLHIHESVVAATTGNINITNDLQLGDVIDGVTLANTNRVLVKNQTAPAENGIYVVQPSGAAIRATDFDAAAEVDGGDFVFVTGGNTQADTGWVQTAETVVTIGSDPISFTQFSGAGTFLAGNGLELNGNIFSIDETVTATRGYVNDEISDLDTDLKAYADQAETDAISSANSYTDGRETAITNAYETYADQAETDAKAYTDTRETAITTAYQTYADQAETDAKAYTDTRETAITTAYQTYADQAETDAKAYTDTRETAITTAYQTYADQAETDAKAYTDTRETAITTAYQTYADQAETDAKAYADALTTSDIAEGTSQYFTDARAKSAAADLLTAATKTNITITGTGSGLTITAENGVADSDTDDLDEGSSNLYFTDQRAVDALQAVTPVFEEIDVNSIALNVASSVTVATQNTTGTVYSFDSGTYTSAKFLVKSDTGTHTEVMEVLVTLDGSSNIAITEYAIVNTGGSLADITAVMNGTDVELQATVVNDNTVVRAYGTLIV